MNVGLSPSNKTVAKPFVDAASCIHELFESQASKTPNATAVSCGTQALTYRELNEQANQLAHYLRNLGVKPETPVALYLERSLNMVVAILGVLKSGGAYVPIDLSYPKERLSFMLEDTQAPLLLTQASLRTSVPAHAPKVICLDSDWASISLEPTDNPSRRAKADNAAYIIYTSGSTGKPKGVLVTHHNVARLLRSTRHWYGFNANDVWPLFHSYAFDVSVWELWGALFHGGRLVVVPYLVTRSPLEFYDLLAREKVTVLNQTPSAFRQLIWAEANAGRRHELNLRYVICAGEALELQSLRPWFELHGDQRPQIVNMYGITETTVHSTYRVIQKSDLQSGAGSLIGVPIPDLQLYLVDENLRPVPAGTAGEICIGGAGVARGYLNRPELTSKRFLQDPFNHTPGARIYRSGDLARLNASGELEYLGRMDHQVKIRGFRVELGEIESALNRHPGIRESIVIAHDDDSGDRRLIAYIVPSQARLNVSELRSYLAQKLPDYMIPAVFMFLDWLPLTTNGKVDRRALPRPNGERPELSAEFVSARGSTEELLAKIWSEVLGLKRVGAQDNFFELGGDSIQSIRILSQARCQGLSLSLQDLFQHPTIGALARIAESAKSQPELMRTEAFALIPPEERARLPLDIEDAYPATRLQMGMFFFNELDPSSAVYHDVFSYRVRCQPDVKKFQEALSGLVRRHPQLRASFELEGYSCPLQLIHRTAELPLTLEDLTRASAEVQDRRVVEWIEEEKKRPFNRRTPPLVRFHVQLRSEREFQLFVSFHHCCLDGWSLAAVVTEILETYTSLLRGQTPATTEPAAKYRDFVSLEQRAIASAESRRFWMLKLQDSNPALLPRWPASMRQGGREQLRGPEVLVPDSHFEGLKKLAQANGVPLRTVLLAAHLRVLQLVHGQNDITTGLITSGRPEEIDGEKILGLFLNTLPLRQQLAGGTWNELVKQTFASEQEIVPHRRFPLSEIQKLMGGKPLFETAFDFVHFHVYRRLQESTELDLAEGHYFEANNLTSYTTFMLDVTGSKLEVHIDYDPNALCREQVQALTEYYLRTLEAMSTEATARYDRFSPLTEREARQILLDWNATEQEFPRDKTVADLFEERARETPEAVALEVEGRRLSYGDLNNLSEQFARRLRAFNSGPGELIGIFLERSVEMVAALLAVFKVGAAYVPLDPAYPESRLQMMLQDAELRILLTQEALVPCLPACTAQVLTVESLLEERGEPTKEFNGLDPVARQATDLAYVIYTSGSTGKPKGVEVTHRSVVNLLLTAAKSAEITANDSLVAVTTLSFDIAALEIFMPLITGGRLTLATRETAADGQLLASLIESSGATVMQATPATWRLLIDSGWQGKTNLKVFCGGEALQRGLADELLSRTQAVWNFYGPTETTIWSTAWKVQPNEPITIGRPLANTQAYILDGQLRPVPIGTVGELHLGGEGVARGYWQRDELTAEKFVPSPFGALPAARLYRTGDMARFLPDGRIECLGRIDHQVKLRGFRIELGEIESAIRGFHGIADAIVSARETGSGEKRLIGYLISKNGPPSVPDLQDYIKAKLPTYMVPSQFVVLKQFPRMPNGKIDRNSLPAPEGERANRRTYVAPRNSDEQQLAEIWQEVLELKQVGIEDDFFELGGDSLSATRAFARTNRRFGTELSLKEILDHPTIRSLGELVSSSKGSAPKNQRRIPRQPRLNKSQDLLSTEGPPA